MGIQKRIAICWITYLKFNLVKMSVSYAYAKSPPRTETRELLWFHYKVWMVFIETFLDYTGNCYKYFLMPLPSTQLKRISSFWSSIIAEVLPICPCNGSWMPCPVTLCRDLSMTAVPMILAEAVAFTHPKKQNVGSMHLLYACYPWLSVSWQVALQFFQVKVLRKAFPQRWTAWCDQHLLSKRANIIALNLESSCLWTPNGSTNS